MKRLIKKSILNGFIRTIVSVFINFVSTLKALKKKTTRTNGKYSKKEIYKSDEINLNYCQINNNLILSNEEKNSKEIFYEYTDDDGQIFKLSPKSLKIQKLKQNEPKKQFRFKAFFVCFFIIVAYVGLNNYLIMFVYYHSTVQTSSSDSNQYVFKYKNSIFLPFASLFGDSNEKLNKKLNDKTKIQDNYQDLNDNYTILIDPLDLDFNNFDKKKLLLHKYRRLIPETFFEENSNGKNETNFLNNRPCVLPKLDPYETEIMQYVKKEEEIKCNPKQNWIYVENGTLRVSKFAIRKHGVIVCAYIPLYRGNNDFSVYEGTRIFPVIDKMPLITDFFKIDCRSKDGAIYSNIHSGIAYDSSLHMRHIWNPLPRKALGYNVLMFGFDSVSRMSWIRMLPKSYEYMIQEGFIVLKGYNIVGDGTPQALLPILTGKKEIELPEARRGFINASYVDDFPWIWRDYKRAGYVTQWAEDMQSIGTFQLRMLGFKKQPVDHYMRLFYLEAEKYYNRFRRLCLGSISRHKNMMNWVKEFFSIYGSKPKFSFIFHSEASHNYNNPLNLLDEDLKNFLQYLKYSGIMKNTILLFMSDHGLRVSDLRQYSQGKLEERLPFFSILMPRSFQEKYPDKMKNLRQNSRKLTTPFDIHETLKHILNFETYDQKSNDKPKRGMSLFNYISPNRSCEDAEIEAHWCSCLKWTNINIFSQTTSNANLDDISQFVEIEQASTYSNVQNFTGLNLIRRELNLSQYKIIKSELRKYSNFSLLIAKKSVEYMNSLIDKELKFYCEKLYLHSIQKLSKLNLNRRLLAFKKSKDIHGREALFEENLELKADFDDEFFKPMNNSIKLKKFQNLNQTSNETKLNDHLNFEHVFQIVLTTWPGNAVFELSCKYNQYSGIFKFNKNEISRINRYNSTSNCIINKRPDLRQYCYCKYL